METVKPLIGNMLRPQHGRAELRHGLCELTLMSRKARWFFTAATAALLLSGVLAEVATGGLSRAFECLGKSPIAGLVARGNALAIVP